jgi:hypothetical protein
MALPEFNGYSIQLFPAKALLASPTPAKQLGADGVDEERQSDFPTDFVPFPGKNAWRASRQVSWVEVH